MTLTGHLTDCQQLLRESAHGVTLVVLTQAGSGESRSNLVQVAAPAPAQIWTEEEPTWEDAAWV